MYQERQLSEQSLHGINNFFSTFGFVVRHIKKPDGVHI